MLDLKQAKTLEAIELFADCFGERGIHASPDRYRGQCWTRDLGVAIQPALFLNPFKGLPSEVQHGAAYWMDTAQHLAERHLREIEKRMRPSADEAREQLRGRKAPIVFLDGPGAHVRFLADKVGRSIKQGRPSFMLKRYLQGKLWQLTPETKDSELLFCHAVLEHAELSGDGWLKQELFEAVGRALRFIEEFRMDSPWPEKKVLIVGGDWRDTMPELGDKALLSNNAILYAVFRRMGWDKRAQAVQDKIRSRRDKEGLLLDYEGADWFDPLGGALAVLYDLATPEDYAGILRGFKQVDTPRGVTIKCKHNAYGTTAAEVAAERAEIERTQGVVIWPFVAWFAAMAAQKIADSLPCADPVHGPAQCFALDQKDKLLALRGMHEWYSPDTGRGWGAPRQLWSAAMLLRALHGPGKIP